MDSTQRAYGSLVFSSLEGTHRTSAADLERSGLTCMRFPQMPYVDEPMHTFAKSAEYWAAQMVSC